MGVPMSTAIAIAGIRKRNSHALRNDAMSGVWIRKLGRSISGANSSRITRNTPASFGFTTIISLLNKSRSSSRIRTTNRSRLGAGRCRTGVDLGSLAIRCGPWLARGLTGDFWRRYGYGTASLCHLSPLREDSGMMNYADWLALVWLPQAQPLSSQRIGEQLAVVDQSLMDRYFKRRHDRLLKARQKVSAADIPQFWLWIPPASALTQRPSPRLPMAMPDRILICGK